MNRSDLPLNRGTVATRDALTPPKLVDDDERVAGRRGENGRRLQHLRHEGGNSPLLRVPRPNPRENSISHAQVSGLAGHETAHLAEDPEASATETDFTVRCSMVGQGQRSGRRRNYRRANRWVHVHSPETPTTSRRSRALLRDRRMLPRYNLRLPSSDWLGGRYEDVQSSTMDSGRRAAHCWAGKIQPSDRYEIDGRKGVIPRQSEHRPARL